MTEPSDLEALLQQVRAERDALKRTIDDLSAQLSVERFKLQTITAWIKAVPNV